MCKRIGDVFMDVVAAIIENNDGDILIAKRNLKKAQGGLWEFPGGKIEKNESADDAIKREIKEELNIDIEINKWLIEKKYEYPERTINLILCSAKWIGGDLNLFEHEDSKWIKKEDIFKYEFAEADSEIINEIFK